jgi:hypothetical protein
MDTAGESRREKPTKWETTTQQQSNTQADIRYTLSPHTQQEHRNTRPTLETHDTHRTHGREAERNYERAAVAELAVLAVLAGSGIAGRLDRRRGLLFFGYDEEDQSGEHHHEGGEDGQSAGTRGEHAGGARATRRKQYKHVSEQNRNTHSSLELS